VYVGLAKISLAIQESHSLKEKRMVLRRIKDRVRERAGVILSEVGEQDIWQRSVLGCAVASGDPNKARELVDEVVRIAMAAGGAQIIGIARDVMPYDGEPAPVVVVDDRTGAGDKAVGTQDDADWIPDAWREEAKL
jgi:uncharacterized protein YlxP (DUF503 family)